tara:strand:+ start:1689 stop:2450 length:762 start_codon:yes stop_codon:yes gene_type:complete
MKKNNHLISIIIPYFKKKNYIIKTVKSILKQKYKNIEIVFIYDDIDKEDLYFLKKFLKPFKKIKLIINKKNYGVAKSRNIGLKHCKGSYIAFLDSDDIWRSNKLVDQYNFMQKKKALFSFTSYKVINLNDKIINKRKVEIDADYISLSKSNYIGLSTVMFHRKLLKKIKFPKLKTQEDYAVWLKLLRNGEKLYHYNKFLTYWRESKDSLSSNIFDKLRDAFKVYYIYENKNLLLSIYSVIILSFNKLKKQHLH